jgi:hypothetical protein
MDRSRNYHRLGPFRILFSLLAVFSSVESLASVQKSGNVNNGGGIIGGPSPMEQLKIAFVTGNEMKVRAWDVTTIIEPIRMLQKWWDWLGWAGLTGFGFF